MHLAAIPGFQEALAKVTQTEAESRDFAFLGLPRQICGVEVMLMTLRQYMLLRQFRNPLLTHRDGSPDQVAQFLWILSPHYLEAFCPGLSVAQSRSRKAVATRRRRQFVMSLASIPFSRAKTEIGEYLDEIFGDSPSNGANGLPITSFAAVIIEFIAAEYGRTDHEILNTPLPVIYQHIRRIILRHNPKATILNPRTDKIKREFLGKYLAKREEITAPSAKKKGVKCPTT